MMSRKMARNDEEPPSYQDAIVQGIYMRSGKTPFPDAPRLNPRGLDLSASQHQSFDSIKKFMDPVPDKSTIMRESSARDKRSKPSSSSTASSSGWQSDSSFMKPHKSAPSTAKRKTVTFTSNLSAHDVAESRVVPVLAYHPRRPILLLDFSKPLSRMKIMGDIPTQVRDSDLDQFATTPVTTSMHISINDLGADVEVRNRRGVTIRDVIDTLRKHLYVNISRQEWDEVKQPYRDKVKVAFRDRCRSSDLLEEVEQRRGLRRVDLLCENVFWKGLAPDNEKTNSWILTLSHS